MLISRVGISSVILLAALFGCKKEKSGKSFDFSAVAPIVNEATPKGLQGSTAKLVLADAGDVETSLEAMFKGTFGKISGGNGTGYVNSNLEDLDSRVDELEGRFTELPGCFSNELKSFSADLGSHVDAKIAMKLQCRDEFSAGAGEKSAPGSGMAWGQREKSESAKSLTSLMLVLKHKTSKANSGSDSYDAGFGYAATVEAGGTDDEAVEIIFGQFNTKSDLQFTDQDQPLLARIYAKPKSNSFELAMTSTMPNAGGPISGGTSSLGCGFYLVSNGTIIVAKGKLKTAGSGGDCTTDVEDFEICVNAETLADASSASATECTELASTKPHIASTDSSLDDFDYSKLTADKEAASKAIFAALNISGSSVKDVTSSVD